MRSSGKASRLPRWFLDRLSVLRLKRPNSLSLLRWMMSFLPMSRTSSFPRLLEGDSRSHLVYSLCIQWNVTRRKVHKCSFLCIRFVFIEAVSRESFLKAYGATLLSLLPPR